MIWTLHPSALARLSGAALLLAVSDPAAGGGPIFTDGFEAGSFCAWSNPWYPDVDGDGWGDAESVGIPTTCPLAPNLAFSNDDCDDESELINPGAFEITTNSIDDDCDAEIDEDDNSCISTSTLSDTDPAHAAKALGICQLAGANGSPGLLDAAWVRADETPTTPTFNVGLLDGFGINVSPRQGDRMVALSTGHARDLDDPSGCGSENCTLSGLGTAPPGFPQSVPACPQTTAIYDDIALRVRLRVPTNALGAVIRFDFYSFEYPESLCSEYNDQMVILVAPAPPGSINGNVSFDVAQNPISVNAGFFVVCTDCPLGTAELEGTGFGFWDDAGATSWLNSSFPVEPGGEITLMVIIWDGQDSQLDSTVLVDQFEWLATATTVSTQIE